MANAQSPTPLVLHVKTALREDDAQICVAPNLAWAALSEGRPVKMVFDASAVQSIAKDYGWRGKLGAGSSAMDRANLPDREREALAEQLGVPLDTVPADYGAYLRFLRERGAQIYYNRSMTVLFDIDADKIDSAVAPLDIKELLHALTGAGDYLVY
jgi:hypothetical protein